MTTNLSGEDLVLDRVRRALERAGGGSLPPGVAIGDDAAVWLPRAGYETVATCDWFLEGTHFLVDRHPPHAVGWKCLARAASDLAAMGATPRCFLLSLALPEERTGAWLDNFLAGLRAAAERLACPAAGGDTTRRKEVLISVTAIGECRRGRRVLRRGAKPGDAVLVSGRLGEAEYGLRRVRGGRGRVDPGEPRLARHLYPEPRLSLGAWLAERGLATAMMDLSDGLASDLPRLCRASGVGARIEESRLPLARPAKSDLRKLAPLAAALQGGEDYELLFTVAPAHVGKIPSAIQGVRLTRIGAITAARKIVVVAADGAARELAKLGWDPFRR
jgi:thiamine-monophosphate kinase